MPTETLIVQLAERSYPIHFSDVAEKLKADISSLRASGRCVRVISDAGVLKAHPEYLTQLGFENGEILSLPQGKRRSRSSSSAKRSAISLARHLTATAPSSPSAAA